MKNLLLREPNPWVIPSCKVFPAMLNLYQPSTLRAQLLFAQPSIPSVSDTWVTNALQLAVHCLTIY